jgi:pyrroloquinoline quinone biosynthesis protein E
VKTIAEGASSLRPGLRRSLSRNWLKIYYNAGMRWVESRFFTGRPLFLAHAVTYACDLRCKMCTNWQMSDRARYDLEKEEIFNLLSSARRAGYIGYYLWGGEPLLRPDLPEILNYAKDNNFITIMNTNASRLEERAEAIGPNLDYAFISLDSPDELHDDIRGSKGSFSRLVKGTKKLQDLGWTVVTFVSTISRINYDKIEALARFAVEMGCGISYNAVERTATENYTNATSAPIENYGLNRTELRGFYEKLSELKKNGYPLGETKTILEDYVEGKPFRCRFPRIFTYVTPEGLITPCTPQLGVEPVDLRKTSLEEYLASDAFDRYAKSAEFCNLCVRTCVRTYSYTYQMDPFQIMDLVSTAAHFRRSTGYGLFF